MSLGSILKHIVGDADAESEKILKAARAEAGRITEQAHQEAEALYQANLAREKTAFEKGRLRLVVNARLENRKLLLGAKQELIDAVFNKLKSSLGKSKPKKQEIMHDKTREASADIDFYLSEIRLDFENQVARILFGE